MSQSAILSALFEYLRERVGVKAGEIGIEPPDSSPPPIVTDRYIAVTVRGVQNTGDRFENESHINEWHTVEVVVFLASQLWPEDRHDTAFIRKVMGIDQYADKIIAAIHGRHELRIAASDKLDTEPAFASPLFYVGSDPLEYRSGLGETANLPTWMVQRVRFEGLRRMRTIQQLAGA